MEPILEPFLWNHFYGTNYRHSQTAAHSSASAPPALHSPPGHRCRAPQSSCASHCAPEGLRSARCRRARRPLRAPAARTSQSASYTDPEPASSRPPRRGPGHHASAAHSLAVVRLALPPFNLRPGMALPVGPVPTIRDTHPYGMSLLVCSYTCPYRKGQAFGPTINTDLSLKTAPNCDRAHHAGTRASWESTRGARRRCSGWRRRRCSRASRARPVQPSSRLGL